MSWFVGDYEWETAEVPYKVKIYLDDGDVYEKVYDEDLVYIPGRLQTLIIELGRSAWQYADSKASRIREHGFSANGTHFPAHRVTKVEVVKCKWEEGEKAIMVPTKKLVEV